MLSEVMERGGAAFYNGGMAERMVDELKQAGGIITMDDWTGYEVEVREPVTAMVKNFEIVGAPPPSSGGATVIAAARFLAMFEEPYAAGFETISRHRLSEALKHAFAMRMSLADPAFGGAVVEDVLKDMVEGEYVEGLFERYYSDEGVQGDYADYGGEKWGLGGDEEGGDGRRARGFQYLEDRGTSHLSVVDKWGNAVAITTTINVSAPQNACANKGGVAELVAENAL